MKALALALLVAAPAGQQFNLDCAGTRERNAVALGKQVEPYRTVYRIDLAAGRWCEDDCLATKPIVDAQPNVLVLEAPIEPSKSARGESFRGSINRVTGEHSRFLTLNSPTVGRMWVDWKGQCRPLPFTGFPEGPRKF